jgi:hypothetical protein
VGFCGRRCHCHTRKNEAMIDRCLRYHGVWSVRWYRRDYARPNLWLGGLTSGWGGQVGGSYNLIQINPSSGAESCHMNGDGGSYFGWTW